MQNYIKLLFIFFILKSNPSFAQLPDSLNLYYTNINKAEIEITKKDYKGAYDNYCEAFRYKKIPFEIDHYNFAICCSALNKKKESFKHLKFLINYGYPIDSLLKNKELKFLSKKKWSKRIFANSKKTLYNTDYKKKIDSLFAIDQKFRQIDKIKFKDTINKIDSLNALSIKNYIEQLGCISETQIGVDFLPMRLLLMHNFQGVTRGENIENLYYTLYDCVLKGEIDVRKAAYFLDGYYIRGSYGSQLLGLCRYAYIYHENGIKKESVMSKIGIPFKPFTDEINKNRQEIGLCSYEDYIVKLKFNYYNKSFRFINPSDRSNIYFSNKEDYDKAIQNLIFLE